MGPGWIATIILGGIAGWLASLVMNRDASMGIFWNIVVGMVGGVIGSAIGGLTGFLLRNAGVSLLSKQNRTVRELAT